MYDMLDWLTLDSNLRSTYHMEGSSNPLYTIMQSGKFYWVKGGLGYPRVGSKERGSYFEVKGRLFSAVQ